MERDLVSRARAGDEAAYEQLVQQHQEAMFRLAYLILGDADDAEDAVQEALIRAFQHLHHFDLERPLRPWLLRISANVSRNRLRSVGRYLNTLKRLLLLDQQPQFQIETLTTQQMEAQALWNAVRRLSPTDQEVIYLRYFLELSVNETAEILNVEPGTVKSRLSRALGRLRNIVEREFPILAKGGEA